VETQLPENRPGGAQVARQASTSMPTDEHRGDGARLERLQVQEDGRCEERCRGGKRGKTGEDGAKKGQEGRKEAKRGEKGAKRQKGGSGQFRVRSGLKKGIQVPGESTKGCEEMGE